MDINQQNYNQKENEPFDNMDAYTDILITHIDNMRYNDNLNKNCDGHIELKGNSFIIYLNNYEPINISFSIHDEIKVILSYHGVLKSIEYRVDLIVNKMRQDYYLYMSLENAFKFKRHIFACLDRKNNSLDFNRSYSNNIATPNVEIYDAEWDFILNNTNELVTIIGQASYGSGIDNVYVGLVGERCIMISNNGMMIELSLNFDDNDEIRVIHREGFESAVESKLEFYKDNCKKNYLFYMEADKAKLFKKHFDDIYSKERARRILLEEHNKQVNRIKQIENKIKSMNFKNEVFSNVKDIFSRNDIKNILINYFNSYSQDSIFLRIKGLSEVETYLYNKSNFGVTCLKNEENFLKYDDSFICPEHFIMLNSFLCEKEYITNAEQSFFITWELINKFAISYYAQLWDGRYNGYFSNIKDLSLKECVKLYYSIDVIDHGKQSSKMSFVYYLINHEKFHDQLKDYENQVKCYDLFEKLSTEIKHEALMERRIIDFENNILGLVTHTSYSIEHTDNMTGEQFEGFLKTVFEKKGYKVSLTKATGDQGIDLILTKNSSRIGVQAKCYNGMVSNSAIQQVVAGLKFHNCVVGMVITNSYFTKSAKELAKVNNINLWDRDKLENELNAISH